jgi:molybdopterin converting factor small subunit
VKIGFYGRLAQAIGPKVEVDIPAHSRVGDVRRILAEKFPGGAATLASGRSKACVSGAIVGDEHRVSEGDEIEFLPPVSGG